MNKNKAIGFYIAMLAGLVGIVSLIRFGIWAPQHKGMDAMIIVALITGILLDALLFFKDHGMIMVASTTAYTIAAVRLLANSVGSFVDAFQGVNMFGDATQVGTIISIFSVMMISVLLSIVASFMNRTKENAGASGE